MKQLVLQAHGADIYLNIKKLLLLLNYYDKRSKSKFELCGFKATGPGHVELDLPAGVGEV